jgi:hypothetical protein
LDQIGHLLSEVFPPIRVHAVEKPRERAKGKGGMKKR